MESPKPPGTGTFGLLIAATAIAILLVVGFAAWRFRAVVELVEPPDPPPLIVSSPRPALPDAATQAQVKQFCGACHVMPSPEQFPRVAWYHEVERGFKFYNDSDRTDLHPPPSPAGLELFPSPGTRAIGHPPHS